MRSKIHYCLCSWLFFMLTAESARILAIHPIRARSHFHLHETILNSLVSAGHHVTIVSPFPPTNASNDNFTHIDSRIDEIENDDPWAEFDFKRMPWWETEEILAVQCEAECHEVMKLKHIHDLLHSNEKKYDVLFLELLPMHECFYPIALKQGIPMIGTLSMRAGLTVDRLGNTRNPAVIPFESQFQPKVMTFYERAKNSVNHVINELYYNVILSSRIKEFYKTYCPSCDLENARKISLAFVNNNPSFFPRALVPTTIDIGGIHLKTNIDPLPKELKKFVEDAEHGVILFTIGTVTNSKHIGLDTKNIFREAFARIPQRVIWKFEGDIEDLPDNVFLSKWLPQTDILAHNNVKAFISHCGIHGTYEAIYTGKPVVAIPIFGDQPANAAFLKELGVAVYLDILTLTTDDVVNALHAVVNDTRYRENMQKLSRAFADRPISPQEAIVYWTEYVIRYNGTEHLRTTAADMPLYQYLLLDVIFFAIAVLAALLCIMVYSLKKMYGFCFARNSVKGAALTVDSKKRR